MRELISWINENKALSCPLVAGIAHYQIATIHPYYDGNGRTGRLLTTLILHMGGYDLKGLYSLEEYYAKNLTGDYHAISIGPSHNITPWLEYFTAGIADAFEKVIEQMLASQQGGNKDHTQLFKTLNPRQRKALTPFHKHAVITATQLCTLFNVQPRTGAALCQPWVQEGFLMIDDPSNKRRTYTLAPPYDIMFEKISKKH